MTDKERSKKTHPIWIFQVSYPVFGTLLRHVLSTGVR
jgi:hypothetical protein